MIRPVLGLLCAGAIVAAGCTPALADDTTQLGTSYAAAVAVAPGTGIDAVTADTGDLGDLLDFLTPVTDGVITPLSNALTAMPGVSVADAASALAGASATSSSTSVSAPAGGAFPDCSADEWSAGNCYSAASTAATGALVRLTADMPQGFAAADHDGSSSSARTAGVSLQALGVPIGSLGTATATASCPTTATSCSASGGVSDLSLLDGQIRARSADDGSLQVSVAGGDWTSGSALASTQVDDAGRGATVSADGSTVRVAVSMTLDELLLAAHRTDPSLDSLSAYDDGSTVTLDVNLSPGTRADGRSSGLRVGVGLSADIRISVLGLVGTELTVADSPTGNLLTVQLAYAAAAPATGASSENSAPAALK